MTIVTIGNDAKVEQITKQLNKLVDIIKVVDLTEENFVDRELVLIKMNAEAHVRAEMLRIVELFRAKVVDVKFFHLHHRNHWRRRQDKKFS